METKTLTQSKKAQFGGGVIGILAGLAKAGIISGSIAGYGIIAIAVAEILAWAYQDSRSKPEPAPETAEE